MKIDPLILTGGVHTIVIRGYLDFRGQRTSTIECIDDNSTTINMYGQWVEENESASFYLTPERIDLIIEKLIEAKKYLEDSK